MSSKKLVAVLALALLFGAFLYGYLPPQLFPSPSQLFPPEPPIPEKQDAEKLFTEGRYFFTADGTPFVFHGVLKTGFFAPYGSYNEAEAEYQAIASYGFNVVRRFFSRDHWIENPVVNQRSYQEVIERAVTLAAKHNLYFILSLYYWDGYERGGGGLTMPPNQDAWVDLWIDVARKLKHHWNIIYEIHNEPRREQMWRNYHSWAQAVIDGIRLVDPDTVIVVPFHDVNDAHAFYDRPLAGNNLAYDFHVYRKFSRIPGDGYRRSELETWLRQHRLDAAIQRFPVLCGEFGGFNASPEELAFVRTFCEIARDWGFGWIGHRWPWESDGDFAILSSRRPYQLSAVGQILSKFTSA